MRSITKSRSTFKRLVLVDEAAFEELKKGSDPGIAQPVRAYTKDTSAGRVEHHATNDADRLALRLATSLREPQTLTDEPEQPVAKAETDMKTEVVAPVSIAVQAEEVKPPAKAKEQPELSIRARHERILGPLQPAIDAARKKLRHVLPKTSSQAGAGGPPGKRPKFIYVYKM